MVEQPRCTAGCVGSSILPPGTVRTENPQLITKNKNKMNQFRFLNWQVYKDSKALFRIILKITEDQVKFKYSVNDQLIRAAYSIVLNIAEGSGKESDKELKRYFNISLGSCYELLAGVDTLKDMGIIDERLFADVFNRVEIISKQLGGFKKFIKNGY